MIKFSARSRARRPSISGRRDESPPVVGAVHLVSSSDGEGGLFGRLVKGRKKSQQRSAEPESAEPQEPAEARQETTQKEKTQEDVEKSGTASSGTADSVPSESETSSAADPALTPVFQAPLFLAPPQASSATDAPAEGVSSSHRRRARRKEGEQGDAPIDGRTVVKVRPRRQEVDAPVPVKGSTRLEAKRQRRSSGREAGRRRSVLTEVEFHARREAVDRKMIVRSTKERIQIGVLEDGVLVEHYVAKSQDQSMIGNVYLGRVQNVLPSMEAAFVDIGRGRNAVLYSGEVDWDAAETGSNPKRIEFALKAGDTVLVQVTKDPVGHKGARLTSQVSLPGRYLVYVPGGSMNGISRKLPDSERARLKKVLKEVLPQSAGVIVRTAAEGATEEQLTADVQRLQRQWEELQASAEKSQAPVLLHSEPDLLIKIVRDVFNEDFGRLIVSGAKALETIRKYLGTVAPELLERVEEYEGEGDIFDHYRVNEMIAKALERKVWLPSGGTLVIDRTEAMTVIDVNTGKFVGSGGNLEETVTKNNLEAAEEIVRQLRLRDIGGIIVVDFIDMVLEANRDLVLRRLIECLGRDRTKHQVAEVTSLGLIQMTRKKIGIGLLESFSETCEACGGRGVVIHSEPVLKQKSVAPEHGGRRGKGERSGSSGNRQHKPTINDDVKNAVAQIAASTLAAGKASSEVSGSGPSPSSSDEATPAGDAPLDAGAASEVSPQIPRAARSKARGARQRKTPPAATETNAPVVTLPEPKPAETRALASEGERHEVEHLLDAALDTISSASASAPVSTGTPAKTRRGPRRARLRTGEAHPEVEEEDFAAAKDAPTDAGV